MRHSLFILIFLFFNCFTFGQNKKLDTLFALIKAAKEDTTKVKHLYSICAQYYLTGEYDEALKYGKQALALAQHLAFEKGEVDALNNLGLIYNKQGNFPEALRSHSAALKISERIHDKKGIADAQNYIGAIYNEKGNYPLALKNHFASLKIYAEILQSHPELVEIKRGMANSNNDIGNIYYNQNNYTEAVDNYFSALKLFEEIKDKEGIAETQSNIGNIYDQQGNYEEALKKHFTALAIEKEIGNKVDIATTTCDIGDVYNNKAEHTEALKMYLEALKIYEEIGEKEGIAICNLKVGKLFISENKTKDAQNYLTKALEISKTVGLKEYCRDSYAGLALVDSILGNYKAALAEHKLFILYRDSLHNEETEKLILQSAMQYEYDKKEAISKAEQEKKDAMVAAEEHKQKIIIWSVVGGLLLMALFTGFVFRSLQVTRKQKAIIELQKNEVEKQKHIVEAHQKEIIDSINYAERIQRSFIATKEILNENLNDYFVFFKPKDIVSGDFYWAGKLNNGNFALVTADSTGHGVPGAIMSLLNITSLEKAVEDKTTPSEILNITRNIIIDRLKKDGSPQGGKDGMDCSITIYDFANKKLVVAAANNPVWIVRGTETIEIKPDKMPVGKHDKDTVDFTQQEIDLQKDDVVYTLTDGFPDQFGGEKGKKFMSKRLKELLAANAGMPMHEQKQLLEKTFSDWVGNFEQIDDVTLIGVRI